MTGEARSLDQWAFENRGKPLAHRTRQPALLIQVEAEESGRRVEL